MSRGSAAFKLTYERRDVRRILIPVVGLALLGVFNGVAPAAAQTDTSFCTAALEVDHALAALEEGKLNQRELDRASAALTALEGTAPPEIEADVDSIVGIVRDALESDEDPTTNPTFQQDDQAIGAYRYSSCGYQTADVTLLEYEFTGLPKSFTTGTVAFKITNTGTEVHELAIARLKTSDRFKKTLALPEHDQEKKLSYIAQGLAPRGETSYLFVDFTKAGRYGAACHIPVGTTRLAQLDEPAGHDEHGGGGEEPHWNEGMLATFRVTTA
jgi:hypothetical protein